MCRRAPPIPAASRFALLASSATARTSSPARLTPSIRCAACADGHRLLERGQTVLGKGVAGQTVVEFATLHQQGGAVLALQVVDDDAVSAPDVTFDFDQLFPAHLF